MSKTIKCHYCEKKFGALKGLSVHVGMMHKNVPGNRVSDYNQITNTLLEEFRSTGQVQPPIFPVQQESTLTAETEHSSSTNVNVPVQQESTLTAETEHSSSTNVNVPVQHMSTPKNAEVVDLYFSSFDTERNETDKMNTSENRMDASGSGSVCKNTIIY
jgi:hypothetical protein